MNRNETLTQTWPSELRQSYVRKFALVYSATTLAFSAYFTPQDFKLEVAILVNGLLFLIGAPYWFRNSRVSPYALNVLSQIANAGASFWICSFLGPTSHVNLVAIPQFIMALMMFRGVHPRTSWAMGVLCFGLLLLPLVPFVNTWKLDKRMPEEELVILRAVMDVTIFAFSTYQFRIISEAWTKLVIQAENEKALHQNANEWRRKLLRILSHDIKEPVVHTLAAARNLKQHLSGHEAEWLNQIEWAQLSIKEMITNVEHSEREDHAEGRPRVSYPREVHLLPSVLEKLLPWFQSRLREKGITLDCSAVSDEEAIVGSKDLFVYQVFLNLLSNAVKFTPQGGTVQLKTFRGPSREVVWTITDSGSGISHEAFAPHPLPRRGTSGERGSGLGLQIARGFAEESGVELVWASSRIGCRYDWIQVPETGTRVALIQGLTQKPEGSGVAAERI